MSFKSLSIVAAAALALCGGAAQAATANAFADPSFEVAPSVAGQFAQGWRGTNVPAVQTSADAHTGTYSALLTVPLGFGAGGLAGNSVLDGGMLPIDASAIGTDPIFSFWAKGTASATGNFSWDIRYLDATGNILNPLTGVAHNNQALNSGAWQQISFDPGVIPVGTSAVFFEAQVAVGPVGITQCGVDNITGLPVFCDLGTPRVLIDDLNLQVNVASAVPEPESYALMLAGLGIVGAIVRRRRSV